MSRWITFMITTLVWASAFAGPPKDPTLRPGQRPALLKYIKQKEFNLCYDDKAHTPVGELKLYTVGSCLGRRMYILDLNDIKFRVDGKVSDCAGYHEGSGGRPYPLLAWDERKKSFRELYSGQALELPSLYSDVISGCDDLRIHLHHIQEESIDQAHHEIRLRYQKAKDRYGLEVVRRVDGKTVRVFGE